MASHFVSGLQIIFFLCTINATLSVLSTTKLNFVCESPFLAGMEILISWGFARSGVNLALRGFHSVKGQALSVVIVLSASLSICPSPSPPGSGPAIRTCMQVVYLGANTVSNPGNDQSMVCYRAVTLWVVALSLTRTL